MKLKSLFLAALAALSIVACTDDKEDTPQEFPQEFVFDGTRYEWGESFLINYGAEPGDPAVNLDLNLITDGIDIIYQDGLPDSATGDGYLLYFEMFTSDSTFLDAGTYALDSTPTRFSITSADISTVVAGEFQDFFEITSTSVEVQREQNQYTITGSGKTQDGKDFSFSFQGAIPILDI